MRDLLELGMFDSHLRSSIVAAAWEEANMYNARGGRQLMHLYSSQEQRERS